MRSLMYLEREWEWTGAEEVVDEVQHTNAIICMNKYEQFPELQFIHDVMRIMCGVDLFSVYCPILYIDDVGTLLFGT